MADEIGKYSFPSVPTDNDPEKLKDVVSALIEWAEIREGSASRGGELDQFLTGYTLGDLTNLDLDGLFPGSVSFSELKRSDYTSGSMQPPTSFTIEKLTYAMRLKWSDPNEPNLNGIRVRYNTTNDLTGGTDATLVAAGNEEYTFYPPDLTADYYFWIRAEGFSSRAYSAWVGDGLGGGGGYLSYGYETVDNTIQNLLDGLRAMDPAAYDNTATYYLGMHVTYNSRIYRCYNDDSGAGISGIAPDDTNGSDYWVRDGIIRQGTVDGKSTVGVDGEMVVDGTVYSRAIVTDAITAEKIKAGAVTANKVSISELSEIADDMGLVVKGVLQSPNFSSSAGMEIDLDNAKFTVNEADGLIVNSSGGIRVTGSGDIILDTGAIPLYIGTEGTDDALCFWPGTANNGSFLVGYSSGSNVKRFNHGVIRTQSYFWIDTDDGTDRTQLRVNDNYISLYTNHSSGNDCRFDLLPYSNQIELSLESASGQILPYAHKYNDIGASDQAYRTVHADNFNNVADFYHLDTHDDLAAIHSIKGSGEIEDYSGLEMIDDSTLPDWLISAYPSDIKFHTKKGEVIKHKKGEPMYDPEGRPYLSFKACISLSWGAIRQLDKKVEAEINKLNQKIKTLQDDTRTL